MSIYDLLTIKFNRTNEGYVLNGYSNIINGTSNTATGTYSVILGGTSNIAIGFNLTVNTGVYYSPETVESTLNSMIKNKDINSVIQILDEVSNIDTNSLYIEQIIIDGHLDILIKLHNRGFNLNNRSSINESETILITAIKSNQIDIVKYLVSNGADINLKGSIYSPLEHAIYLKHREIYTYLFQQGPILDHSFILKTVNNFHEITELIINFYPDINRVDNMGDTLLIHYFRNKAPLECIKKLIDHGADVNVRTNSGENILMLSTKSDILFEYVLNNELYQDINDTDHKGNTALMYATKLSQVKDLYNKNIDINIKNSHGRNALMTTENQHIFMYLAKRPESNLGDISKYIGGDGENFIRKVFKMKERHMMLTARLFQTGCYGIEIISFIAHYMGQDFDYLHVVHDCITSCSREDENFRIEPYYKYIEADKEKDCRHNDL